MSKGRIFVVVSGVEQRRSAFAVARLIMLTGTNLRAFDSETVDDPAVFERVKKALAAVISPAEAAELVNEALNRP